MSTYIPSDADAEQRLERAIADLDSPCDTSVPNPVRPLHRDLCGDYFYDADWSEAEIIRELADLGG